MNYKRWTEWELQFLPKFISNKKSYKFKKYRSGPFISNNYKIGLRNYWSSDINNDAWKYFYWHYDDLVGMDFGKFSTKLRNKYPLNAHEVINILRNSFEYTKKRTKRLDYWYIDKEYRIQRYISSTVKINHYFRQLTKAEKSAKKHKDNALKKNKYRYSDSIKLSDNEFKIILERKPNKKSMADISKCKGTNCPLANSCYRYLAIDDTYQSYLVEVPYDTKTKSCRLYWKN